MTNTKPIQIIATYRGAKRAPNSPSANPGWKLLTDEEGELLTQNDASVNYDINNHTSCSLHPGESWVGKRVRFTITQSRRVTHWELA